MRQIHISDLAPRALAVIALTATAASTAFAVDPGQLVVKVHAAHAEIPGSDGCCLGTNQQDFYTIIQFPGDPPIESGWELGHDEMSWNPAYQVQHNVDRERRFHGVSVQLWDDDDGAAGNNSSDDKFDINAGAPNQLDIQFDACTMQWTANGLFTDFGPNSPGYPAFGKDPVLQHGRLDLELTTGDGVPFTPNKLTIVGLDPVQAAFDPTAVVSGKATAIRVRIANTFTTQQSAPVTIEIRDGLTGDAEVRTLTLEPGISTHYFFDGMPGHRPNFFPIKPGNVSTASLVYSAEINVSFPAPPGTPPDLLDCYLMRNGLFDKQTPIVRTIGPQVRFLGEMVVFQPFDYLDTLLPPLPTDVAAMADADEVFRKATWPLADTPHFTFPIPYLAPPPVPLSLLPEPDLTMFVHSIVASIAGVDRVVLVPRHGWFNDNSARPNIWVKSTAIGRSLGEFGPHSVIAELGYKGVSTHELGHTYKLSLHTCPNPGPLGIKCRDEYNYTPTIMGAGIDVAGSIFPTGSGCGSSQTPNSREVCLSNFMNAQDPNGAVFVNWIEPFTYNYLLGQLKDQRDPEMINLSGIVRAPNGIIPPGPPIFEAHLAFSYRFDGVPDIPDPRHQSPPGDTAGEGKFAVRLVSSDGSARTYRFMPTFGADGGPAVQDAAAFSFNVEWDPAIRTLEFYAPSNLYANECETAAECDTSDVLIASRTRTDSAPQVSVLRAGRDTAPPLVGANPPVPTIGPGHQAVLAWNGTDADSPELHAAVMIAKVQPAGGLGMWIPIRAEHVGNQLQLPHRQLSGDPGDYVAQVVVSDGMNSASITSGTLMHVCNYTNQGAEICNGIDDDCDGTIDNALPPPGSIGVSVSKTAVSWAGVAAAETYDVVRGDVATLRSTGGNFTSATQQCLANDVVGSTISFTANPSAGNVWWILVRGSNCLAKGSYNEVGAGQVGLRDAEIAASTAACP